MSVIVTFVTFDTELKFFSLLIITLDLRATRRFSQTPNFRDNQNYRDNTMDSGQMARNFRVEVQEFELSHI